MRSDQAIKLTSDPIHFPDNRSGVVLMQMNVAEAKAKLSQLLAAVDAGGEVVIAREACRPRALSP